MKIKICLMLLFVTFMAIGAIAKPWTFKAKAAIYSSPVMSKNIIYFGDNAGMLYALDKYSGEHIWNVALKGAIKSKPTIHNELVIINDGSGSISAFNKGNGHLIWEFSTGEEVQVDMWDYYLSSPIVDNGSVYVGSGDGHVYALNAQSGKLLWKFKTGGVVHASAVVHQDKLLIGSFDGYFYAINKMSGELIWSFRTVGDSYFPKGEIQRAACIYKDKVIFGSRDFNIYALGIENGRGHWNYKEAGSWIIATPLVYDNSIFFGTSDSHRLYSFNADNGTENWKKKLNMRVYATAIYDQNRIYFGCFNGKVYGVNMTNGATEYEFQTEESKANYSRLFKSETEFVDGIHLYGANAKTVEENIMSLGSFLSTPLIDGNMLFIGDANGYFYGLELDLEANSLPASIQN